MTTVDATVTLAVGSGARSMFGAREEARPVAMLKSGMFSARIAVPVSGLLWAESWPDDAAVRQVRAQLEAGGHRLRLVHVALAATIDTDQALLHVAADRASWIPEVWIIEHRRRGGVVEP